MKKILALTLLCSALNAGWESHPLWVGYSTAQDGRTPGLQGPISKELIKHYLPNNPIIIEAGAHIGSDTSQMAQWPGSSIYCFEPVPHIFAQLKAHTHHLKNVHTFEMALSNNGGMADFYVSSGESDGSSSLLEPKEHLVDHPNVLFSTKISVPTITLDEWAKKNNIDHVDCLWLDMQGFELAMLKASPTIVKTVKVIYTEVSLNEQYAGTPLYAEYKQWLEEEGFEVIREDLPWKDGGNVLFVRKNS